MPDAKHDDAALEVAERALQRGPRRVRRARVVEVLDELAAALLHVGGGLVDRGDDARRRSVGLRPAWTARCVAILVMRQRLEQVGAGDDADGRAVLGDDQRRAAPVSSSTASRTGSSRGDARERRPPSRRRSARPSRRVVVIAACSSPRSPTEPTIVYRSSRGHDRQLPDAVLVQQRDRVADGLVRLHGDERRDLAARVFASARRRRCGRPPRARKPFSVIQSSL